MDIEQKMRKSVAFRKASDSNKERALEDVFQKRLMNIIAKKFNTCFIGAISSIEKSEFGKLWGHGLNEDELTQEQMEWRDIWLLLRTEILNKGNHQLRAALNEIAEYRVKWNRHKLEIPVSKDSPSVCSHYYRNKE